MPAKVKSKVAPVPRRKVMPLDIEKAAVTIKAGLTVQQLAACSQTNILVDYHSSCRKPVDPKMLKPYFLVTKGIVQQHSGEVPTRGDLARALFCLDQQEGNKLSGSSHTGDEEWALGEAQKLRCAMSHYFAACRRGNNSHDKALALCCTYIHTHIHIYIYIYIDIF